MMSHAGAWRPSARGEANAHAGGCRRVGALRGEGIDGGGITTCLLKRLLAPPPPPPPLTDANVAGVALGPQNVPVSFLSAANIFKKSISSVRSGSHRRPEGGKGKRATPAVPSGAQSEVNSIDWWSDIKSIPFGSRLVMPVMFPRSSPTSDHYSKQAGGRPPTYFPTTGNAAVPPGGGQGFTPLPYLAAASEEWRVDTG